MATDNEKKFSVELLKKLVRYEPDTGKLFWLHRTPEVSKHNPGRESFNARFAGKEIRKKNLGYVVVSVSLDLEISEFRGHRVAWALHTGEWPGVEIDHENMVRDDNRWSNLREATHGQNNQNKLAPGNNKSGFKGVHWHKGSGKWRAQIRAGDVRKDLGLHESAELAGKAYAEASKALHGKFSNIQ